MIFADNNPRREWSDVVAGESIPVVEDYISFSRAAAAPAATVDFFPLHHDPNWARSVGMPDIVMSTIQLVGFVDRVAIQWSGPSARVVRRKVRLAHPVHPETTLIAQGRVQTKRIDDSSAKPRHLVDLEIVVTNDRGEVCCPAEVTLEMTPSPRSS